MSVNAERQGIRVASNQMYFAVIAMILSAAAWGMGTVMSKAVLGSMPPVVLLVIQLFASTTALWSITGVMQVPFRARDLRHGWTGLFEPGLAYLIGLIGVQLTTASNATLVSALEPFLILLLAFVLLRERVSRITVLLMMVSVMGVILVTGSADDGRSGTLLGDFLVLVGTASAAMYVIFSRNSVVDLHPLPLAASQHTVGLGVALLALPAALILGEGQALGMIGLETLLFAVLSGLVQYSIAFVLYLNALKVMPATTAAPFLTLIPLFGVGGGVLFLGEMLTPVQFVGGVLIVTAIAVLNWTRVKG